MCRPMYLKLFKKTNITNKKVYFDFFEFEKKADNRFHKFPANFYNAHNTGMNTECPVVQW